MYYNGKMDSYCDNSTIISINIVINDRKLELLNYFIKVIIGVVAMNSSF